MLMTLVLVLVGLVILGVLGLCLLSPLPESPARDLVVTVAPLAGAGAVAVVTNWTCRWLSITQSLPIIWGLAVLALVWGVRRGSARSLVSRATAGRLLLGPLVGLAGFGVAAVPAAIAGDVNPVSATYSVDQLYFAGVSTWITDHPLLPGPTITDSWVGDSYPASAPAGETVHLKLRFGQSAVAAFVSATSGQEPFQTVTALSLLWLLLLGAAVTCLASSLDAGKVPAVIAGVAATSSFFVVGQALEGKNDGLLGASIGLVVLALSWREVRHGDSRLLLAVAVASLVATYSEYLVLVVPAVALMTIVGPLRSLLHRLNLIAWPWALSAVVAPFAWLWMAESFKLASRFTNGPTPFQRDSAWGQLRSALGLVSMPGLETAATLLALALVVVLGVGWLAVVLWHPSRGALLGLVAAVVVLEVNAAASGSGYLVYRVAQLSAPLLVAFGVIGGGVLVGRARRRWLVAVPGLLAVAAFASANLATVVVTTSHERAREQHVPEAFTDDLARFVDKVGGDEVSVLAPKLTDVATLSLALASEPDVQYPVMPPSTSYLGGEPLWDEKPDDYYVLGPGAYALDGATTLVEHEGYRIVTVRDRGTVVVPFQTGGWPRLTWMRGIACARDGSLLLAFSNGREPLLLDVAVHSRDTSGTPVRIRKLDGLPAGTAGRPEEDGRWVRQVVTASGERVRILRATTPDEWSGVTNFVLAFAEPFGALRGADDPALEEYCLDVANDGSDGYDRELSLMRGPS